MNLDASRSVPGARDNAKRVKRRRRRARLLLVVGSVLFSLVVIEIGLRIYGFSYPDFYVVDEQRGYALKPGAEGWFRKEGEAYIRINSDGLRDREHIKLKPPNTLRIAVLGDSYTEALQVPFENSFCAVLERNLRECSVSPGREVEVINFGVGGYGTAQEFITLREHVWGYSPDIVLLAVTTQNDVTENSAKLRNRVQAPYYVYRDGKLVLDESFKNSKGFRLRQSPLNRIATWISDHSRVVQAVSEGSRGLRILWQTRRARSNPSAALPQANPSAGSPQGKSPPGDLVAKSAELGIDNLIYLEPNDAAWNEAWQVTEGLILAMRDEVKSKDAKLLVVTLSNGPQVLPDSRARELFMQRFGVKDLFYPDHRIETLGQREGFPVITLAPEFQAYAQQHNVFLHGFGEDVGNGHWNQVGHRVGGELVAQKICGGVLNK